MKEWHGIGFSVRWFSITICARFFFYCIEFSLICCCCSTIMPLFFECNLFIWGHVPSVQRSIDRDEPLFIWCIITFCMNWKCTRNQTSSNENRCKRRGGTNWIWFFFFDLLKIYSALSILAIQSAIYLSSSGRKCAFIPLALIFNSQTLQRQIKAENSSEIRLSSDERPLGNVRFVLLRVITGPFFFFSSLSQSFANKINKMFAFPISYVICVWPMSLVRCRFIVCRYWNFWGMKRSEKQKGQNRNSIKFDGVGDKRPEFLSAIIFNGNAFRE